MYRYFIKMCLLVLGVLLAGEVTHAATLYWDGNGDGILGGSGTWSTAGFTNGLGQWSTSSITNGNPGPYGAWNQAGGEDIAEFRPPVATVTLSGTVNVSQVVFTNTGIAANSGYILSGGTLNLTGGATIQSHETSSAGERRIASDITGVNGLTKTGSRRLSLSGNNLYSGTTTVSEGSIDIVTSGAIPSGSILNLAGGGIRVYPNINPTAAGLIGSSAISGTGSSATNNAGNLTLSRNDGGTSTYSGAWNGTPVNFIKAGNYTQILGGSGGNINEGKLTVQDGILALAKTGVAQAMGPGLVTVTGGTLRLDASNQINGAASMVMTGGTFNVNGFSEALSDLTLAANSTLDFGASGASVLSLTNLFWTNGTLTVTNWRGSVAGGGTTQLRALNTPAANVLPQVWFAGLDCWGATVSVGGYAEIVPNMKPAIINQPQSNVTETTAYLNGSLSSTGLAATTVAVYWGTNDPGPTATGWGNTNTFDGHPPIGGLTTNVSGLLPGTLHFYRYSASNTYGESWADPAVSFYSSGAVVEVTILATDSQAFDGADGTNTGTFTVSRPGAYSDLDATVSYAVGGTATMGADYSNLTGTVTFPPGSSNATITVYPIPAVRYKGTQTVSVTLTNVTDGLVVGTPSNATVTIDDLPIILYWDGDGTGAEGNPPTNGVGGAGTWHNSSNNWWNGLSYQQWTNSGGENIAEFRPAVETVTLSGTVNVSQVVFTNLTTGGNHTLSGGTLNLTGVATIQNRDTFTTVDTINSVITGTNGLTKTGSVRLVLNTNNLYSGTTTVSQGVLDIAVNGAIPSNSIINLAGGTLRVWEDINPTAAGLTGSSSLTGQGTGNGTLTLSRNDGGTSTFTGTWATVNLNLVKDGNYTQILGGTAANNNPNTPTVTVKGGTLALAKTAGVDAIPNATITLVGGQLRLNTSNQINNAASMVLTGGTFNVNGFSETVSNVTVAASSTLDFGAGAGTTVLTLSNFVWSAGTLSVTNWSGTRTGGGADQLRVTTQPSQSDINHIVFAGYPSTAMLVFSGYWEIVGQPPRGTCFSIR